MRPRKTANNSLFNKSIFYLIHLLSGCGHIISVDESGNIITDVVLLITVNKFMQMWRQDRKAKTTLLTVISNTTSVLMLLTSPMIIRPQHKTI